MRVTIIPADNTVVVDGDARQLVGAVYPDGVHAIQWYEDHGFIERTQGPQERFSDFALLQHFVDSHAAKKATDETKPPVAPEVALSVAIQNALDQKAQSFGYDSALSACSYAALPPGAPFQAEGARFLAWRSKVWAKAYDILGEVQAGARPMPTLEQAMAEMPLLESV